MCCLDRVLMENPSVLIETEQNRVELVTIPFYPQTLTFQSSWKMHCSHATALHLRKTTLQLRIYHAWRGSYN